MAENNIDLEINVETNKATKALAEFGQDGVKALSGVTKAFTAFAALAATGLVFKGLSDAISAAAEADQAVQRLNVALASTGEFTAEASKEFIDYADSVEVLTGIQAEVVLSSVALTKSFGLNNKQTKELTQAALELSAATGQDLDSSVKQLGATYTGTAGRLAKLGTDFKNLTEEQLKNGEAVRLINERFKGTNEALSNTFTGSVAKLSNAFGDIFEALGKVVTQNPVVIASIKEVASVFKSVQGEIEGNQDSFSRGLSAVVSGGVASIAGVAAAVSAVSDVVGVLVKVIQAALLSINSLAQAITQTLLTAFVAIERAASTVILGFTSIVRGILEAAQRLPFLSDAFSSMGINIEQTVTQLRTFEDAVGNQAAGVTKTFGESLRVNMLEASEQASASIVNLGDKTIGLAKSFGEASDKIGVRALISADRLGSISEAVVDAGKGIKNLEGSFDDLADTQAQLDSLKGSFDKLKTSLEAINTENDKQTKSARELFDIEISRAKALIENAEKELRFTGKITKENQQIIDDYKEALRLKTELGEANFGSKFFAFSPSFKNGIEDVFGKAAKRAIEVLETLEWSEVISSAVTTATGAISGAKDDQGALKGVGDILTGALTAFLGPVGAAIGNFITQIVLLGKDNAKEFIKNLIRAVPEFVIAFAEAIPALIDGLIEVFSDPGFWYRLVEAVGIAFARIVFQLPANVYKGIRAAVPELSAAFTRAFETSFQKVAAAFAKLPKQIADFIKNALTGLFSSVVDVFKSLISTFQPLIDAMNTLAEAVRSAGGAFGRGGGKGVIAEGYERAKDALGFARGGVVPHYAASGLFVPRGTDTVPAMLTPGELVVPTGMVKRLDDFMSNGGVNPKYEAMFMSILSALQKPMVVNAEAKVNQSAFADIVLQLNRQNSRLGI